MANEKTQALLKVITRIPMFAGIGSGDAAEVLQSCEFRQVAAGDTVCTVREPSDELCILLSGRLVVLSDRNVELASIEPVAPVGEMGLLTGQPRSATVRVRAASNLLVLKKAAFERLMRKNPTIAGRVYCNVIQLLDQRITDTEQARRHGQAELDGLRERVQAARREVEELAVGGP